MRVYKLRSSYLTSSKSHYCNWCSECMSPLNENSDWSFFGGGDMAYRKGDPTAVPGILLPVPPLLLYGHRALTTIVSLLFEPGQNLISSDFFF